MVRIIEFGKVLEQTYSIIIRMFQLDTISVFPALVFGNFLYAHRDHWTPSYGSRLIISICRGRGTYRLHHSSKGHRPRQYGVDSRECPLEAIVHLQRILTLVEGFCLFRCCVYRFGSCLALYIKQSRWGNTITKANGDYTIPLAIFASTSEFQTGSKPPSSLTLKVGWIATSIPHMWTDVADVEDFGGLVSV